MSTKKGRELAGKLRRVVDCGLAAEETCSLIARHAKTYAGIQEVWCNERLSEEEVVYYTNRELRLEKRIRELVKQLPSTSEGPINVQFDSDPRGYTVRFIFPGEYGKRWQEGMGIA